MKEEKKDSFDCAGLEREAIEKLKKGDNLGGRDGESPQPD